MGHFSTANGRFFNLSDLVHEAGKPCGNLVSWEGDSCEKKTTVAPVIDSVAFEVEEDTLEVPRLNVAGAGEEFIDGLGSVLSCWVNATAGKPTKMGRFHSARLPSMTVVDYMARLRKYFVCSDECFVIALVYMDRMSKTDKSVTVCEFTVHRMLFLALILAAKVHDDEYYSNAYYAKVGGLQVAEVNRLEAMMMKLLDWKLFVPAQEYQLYHSLVVNATSNVTL